MRLVRGVLGVASVALLLVVSPVYAESCEDKLAEIDRLVAEDESLGEGGKQAISIQRDMGAQYCEQGNEGTANSILDITLKSLRQRADKAAAEAARSLPKSSLTPEYLAGDWCTWQIVEGSSGRRDVGRYHFYADGSYHVGLPPSFGLDKSAAAWPHERFLEADYEVLLEKNADSFRTEVHGMRQYTWRRGNC